MRYLISKNTTIVNPGQGSFEVMETGAIR